MMVRLRSCARSRSSTIKIFFAGVAIVVAVFLLPTDPLGLDGTAAQIALAVIALAALPATVALALFARTRAGNDPADPETALRIRAAPLIR